MENTFEEDYPEYCKEKEPQKPIWIQKYCVWIDGHICDDLHWSVNTNDMDKIGNLFDTKEEAEKAVEKLRALTEAKEDGLKIKGYYYNHEDLVILADIGKCNKLTLDTLFGKEID